MLHSAAKARSSKVPMEFWSQLYEGRPSKAEGNQSLAFGSKAKDPRPQFKTRSSQPANPSTGPRLIRAGPARCRARGSRAGARGAGARGARGTWCDARKSTGATSAPVSDLRRIWKDMSVAPGTQRYSNTKWSNLLEPGLRTKGTPSQVIYFSSIRLLG